MRSRGSDSSRTWLRSRVRASSSRHVASCSTRRGSSPSRSTSSAESSSAAGSPSWCLGFFAFFSFFSWWAFEAACPEPAHEGLPRPAHDGLPCPSWPAFAGECRGDCCQRHDESDDECFQTEFHRNRCSTGSECSSHAEMPGLEETCGSVRKIHTKGECRVPHQGEPASPPSRKAASPRPSTAPLLGRTYLISTAPPASSSWRLERLSLLAGDALLDRARAPRPRGHLGLLEAEAR